MDPVFLASSLLSGPRALQVGCPASRSGALKDLPKQALGQAAHKADAEGEYSAAGASLRPT